MKSAIISDIIINTTREASKHSERAAAACLIMYMVSVNKFIYTKKHSVE